MDKSLTVEKEYLCKLNNDKIKLLKTNPHCIMFFCNLSNINENFNKHKYKHNGFYYKRNFKKSDINKTFDNIDEKFKKQTTFETLSKIKTNLVYKPRGQFPTTTLHLGQLKLFLSTFQFLLKYAPNRKNVHIIYPGSAGGYNIHILTSLFPNCLWYLYDPNPFYKKLYNNPNVVEIHNTLFTDNHCKKIKQKLKNKFVLFISDIRVNCDEKSIARDNELQKKWVETIKPNYAQLKFRLPRLTKKYSYLKGKIYLQMYACGASTETRLVVNGKKCEIKNYNFEKYDNKMYYFNRYLRCSYYSTRINNKCMDHCHDCVAMYSLFKEYKNKCKKTELIQYNYKFNNNFSKLSLKNMINHILKSIPNVKNRFCSYQSNLLKSLKY